MRISIRGTDRGNAVLTALILILVLSTVFISLAFRIGALKRYAHEYKAGVIHAIEETNRELADRYDLY